MSIGAGEALRLVQDAESIYPESAFFLYFRGKIGYLQVHTCMYYMKYCGIVDDKKCL